MDTLLSAISEASVAARKIATPEHVIAVEEKLRSSLREFPLAADHEFDAIGSGPGIYLFDIRFPFETEREFFQFIKDWGLMGTSGLQASTSRAYLRRARQHVTKVEACEFVPFYVGKNKNVRGRVKGHLVGEAEAGTYGLKLLSRKALLDGCTLRASGIDFEMPTEAYFCVQFLEVALRQRLHPIIGKQ